MRITRLAACRVLLGLFLGAVGAGGGGCAATNAPLGEWEGPKARVAVASKAWSYKLAVGTTVTGAELESANYKLFSTISNGELRERLIQLLEASQAEYRKVAPTAPPTRQGADGSPMGRGAMECYVFADRKEWMDFTRRKTGGDARLYLQITRGGYTIGDYFVAYLTAEADTLSVTAHEGFHQFCARHFKGRLPPFLEEGLACTFERVRWEGTGVAAVPRLNPMVNPQRVQALRTILEARAGWPLEKLVTLHAGMIVGEPGARIEAFYSQSWAFARFVQEYKGGKYRQAFGKWVADVVSGEVFDPTGTHRHNGGMWDPGAVRPIMEHYLGADMGTLQREFSEYCDYLAHEEFARQWSSQ